MDVQMNIWIDKDEKRDRVSNVHRLDWKQN